MGPPSTTKARCTMPMNRISHRWRGERRRAIGDRGLTGQALVEFAMASIIFFTIIFGTLDFGRAIYQYSQLTNAVREGARVAKVDPGDTAAIKQKVIDTGVGITIPSGSISVGGGSELGETVTVSVTYQFNLVTGSFLGITVPPYTTSASVVVE